MAEVTESNPAGLGEFDHGELAGLPEYQAASRALDALVHPLRRDDVPIGQTQWLAAVAEMAAALPFSDTCEKCEGHEASAPYAVTIDENWVQGRYRCVNRHTWTCGYALDVPNWI